MSKTLSFIMLFLLCFGSVSASVVTRYGSDFKIVGDEISFKVSDRLGSDRLTLYEDSIIAESNVLPYGQQLKNNNVKFGFTGKELDDTNNYYFNARYYDFDSGKFLGVDPVSDNHAYAFVSNNPMNYVDPTGMYDSDAAESTGVYVPPPPSSVSDAIIQSSQEDFNVAYVFSYDAFMDAGCDFASTPLVISFPDTTAINQFDDYLDTLRAKIQRAKGDPIKIELALRELSNLLEDKTIIRDAIPTNNPTLYIVTDIYKYPDFTAQTGVDSLDSVSMVFHGRIDPVPSIAFADPDSTTYQNFAALPENTLHVILNGDSPTNLILNQDISNLKKDSPLIFYTCYGDKCFDGQRIANYHDRTVILSESEVSQRVIAPELPLILLGQFKIYTPEQSKP